jgi:hypothetical protein
MYTITTTTLNLIVTLLAIIVPIFAAVKDVTMPDGQPVWSVPNLELIFCGLKPREPCQGMTVRLTVNLSEGNYTLTGGEDVQCRTVIPLGGGGIGGVGGFQIPKFTQEWHSCQNPRLQWRWEFEQGKNQFWFFPMSEDGFSNIGIRLLNGT